MENNTENNQKKLFPMMSPGAAATVGLAGVFILYQFVGGLITIIIFGTDIANANVTALRLMTIAGQMLFILLPSLLLGKVIYGDVSFIIRFKKADLKGTLLFILGLAILIPLLQSLIYIQSYLLEQLASSNFIFKEIKDAIDFWDKIVEGSYLRILTADSIFELIFVIVVVAVTPAICEEVLFRGYSQKSLELRFTPWKSILIVSVVFSMYHFNPYGFLGLMLLGAYLGYAAYISESIFVPITLHFLNNFFAILLFYIFGQEELQLSQTITHDEFLTNLISLIFLSITIILVIKGINKYYKEMKIKNGDSDDLYEM